jgi:hypothetical protein
VNGLAWPGRDFPYQLVAGAASTFPTDSSQRSGVDRTSQPSPAVVTVWRYR